ncbi:cell division/cell wall cluster transcriptional repressor MraZ [Amylibacter kogurei]|uniref:Transcriptional regulator MraZ n=1 Tax=Paramylibacter kogurei TaxID=1889778 RepID=A0A2G5K3T8_9RHOB|nr:division/cell wall cluster transcriptional repressor MraZ [Amylibacter kogurei]PIB24206.1 cell division/cell wall cluster transcriptional repressor MraZ [Amylibacter kogurei]
MAQRFKGEFVQKMDGKGRVSIPAAFRRVLEDCDPEHNPDREPQLVLVYGDHRREFIEGFTMTAMEEVDDKIAQLPRGSKPRRALERTFSGQAVQLQVNETGQIVLSPKLREKLGLTNQVFFIASGDTFQIWHPDTYEDQASAMDDYLDEFEEGFDVLTLLDAAPGV